MVRTAQAWFRFARLSLAACGAWANASGGATAPAAAAGLAKHELPIPAATLALMSARGTDAAAPILMRAFKKESEIEIWKRAAGGRYVLIKSFPVCRWSGQLGPKVKQGDRQTPEGFYPVSRRLMNPNSAYYLSFDTGFPNAYDRAQKASGSALMVHGTCSSAGCFAMTDQGIAEIYAIAREAFAGGQQAFQFQSFPFRMSAQNMARHRSDPHIAFWRQLKEGSDRFEATGLEPEIVVREGRYTFKPLPDPAREALAQARLREENAKIVSLTEDGIASVLTTYSDGGQNAHFAALIGKGQSFGMLSRPEALPLAGREIVVIPAKRKRPVAVAALAPVAIPGLSGRLIEPVAQPDMPAASPALAAARAEPSLFAWTALARPVGTGQAAALKGSPRIMAGAFLPLAPIVAADARPGFVLRR